MKNNKTLFFFISSIFLISCDWKAKVAVVKNNLSDTIIVVPWDDREFGLITDSMVYNNRIYMPDIIYPKNNGTIALPGRNFSKAPDSAEIDLYIFKIDSLSFYKKQSSAVGILNHCLFKKLKIQANKVKSPPDTIYITTGMR